MTRAESEVDPTLPPFVQSLLRGGAQLEPIRLDRHGRWWHRGNLIEHERIAGLFSRSVGRTEGGTWVLVVGTFTYPIEVDDTPLFVRAWRELPPAAEGEVWSSGADRVVVELADGTSLRLDPSALRCDDEGLYVTGLELGRGGSSAPVEARFLLAPYLSFVEAFVEPLEGSGEGAESVFVVRTSRGERVALAPRRPRGV